MTFAHESVSENEAERLLASLQGVVSAHVVTDARGRIVEIHVLSAAGLHPKQVVRNVESALSAGLGIEVDRRVISVAQIRTPGDESNGNGNGHPPDDDPTTGLTPSAPAASAAAAPASGGSPAARKGGSAQASADARLQPAGETARLEYVRFESRRDAELCACEVTLRDGNHEIVGSGSGPDTAVGRAEAAARAVLHAIEQARADLRLQLDGAVISASRGRSFVIVSAHAVLQRMTVPLAGAAPLARSPEEAGILAALQATNRWSG